MERDNFSTRYKAALDRGLSAEWCIKVAYKEITQHVELGNMDMDAESEYNPDSEVPDDDVGDNDDDDYIPW
ncbi:hypothetical protein HOS16_gp76 [Shigella phage vB_SflS-ISF001]|uniref:Uncharacterized protein n=1 Tax=Shigella phage vB_SflS-ISF001 TaxID=2048005 RepID=A0A2D1GQ77_9CAUD|nr:hypothetical protein HOS16_gp76 [Shigella phage vB_SflS-ISF001]ATN94154.1 hypothetical protein FLXISF001_076 [Shigella phage vB_SflS-ISF001]